MRYLIYLTTILLIITVSCNSSVSNKDNRDNRTNIARQTKPAVSLVDIQKPSDGTIISSGDEIRLELSLRTDSLPDSIRVFLDGRQLTSLKGGDLKYTLQSGSVRLGEVPLKIIAYSGDKLPQTITHFLTVFSDIEPESYSYRVISSYPHDKDAYTQGLMYHDGFLYESTGVEGKSSLRKVDIESGEVLKQHNLESKFFAEGLAMYKGFLYQLTWTKKVGFVYDIYSFDEVKRVHYNTQGWGLTTDGEQLIMSDGTNRIYFLEPDYFTVTSSFEVYDNEQAVWQLNELEYINGELWANIYMTDRIARIDPATGKVLAYINLDNILPDRYDHPDLDVLNGIAWDKENERLFITGKNWPRLFEIELVRRP